ncbi:MAG: glucosamine-6-phosphate deaminase [Candidatus Pacearchaeota archaeon]
MPIIQTKNYKELSKQAANLIIEEIRKKPNLTMCFATGKTPLLTYNLLTKAYKNKQISFSKIKAFNLDEYYPINPANKQSYSYYMHKNLFNHINIKQSNINLLNGEATNPKQECKQYNSKLSKNPLDIQILGVGVNGHIGFNEPNSSINSKTRLVSLSSQTKKINKTNNTKALTIGIKNILSAKKILLLASGKSKANAIKQLIENKNITSKYPITYLKHHKNLILIIDKAAASALR